MCKSKAEGGQRCAAHTRPCYEAATFGTAEWDDAAAQHATTPEGQERLSEEAKVAELVGNDDEAAALRAALKRGQRRRKWVRTTSPARTCVRTMTRESTLAMAAEVCGAPARSSAASVDSSVAPLRLPTEV